MLQYTHGSLPVDPKQNNGNWFVHRVANNNNNSPDTHQTQILASYTSASSYSTHTYWKSPNSAETSSYPQNGIRIPPEMKVSSKFSHRPKSTNKATPVKGILKNKVDDAIDTSIKCDLNDATPRSSYQSITDATTVNGAASKNTGQTGKRVQFDGIPHLKPETAKESQSEPMHDTKASATVTQRPLTDAKPMDSIKTVKAKLHEAKRVPFGSLYTFRRENSAPILTRKYMEHGDANAKSQIASFIKKLRLAERTKLKRAEDSIKQMEKLDKEIGKPNEKRSERNNDKVRRPRVRSAMFKSADNDGVDSNKQSADQDRVKSASQLHRKDDSEIRGNASPLNRSRLKSRLHAEPKESDITKGLLPGNSFLLSKVNGPDKYDNARKPRAFSAYARHNAYRPPYLKLWKPGESNCYKEVNRRKTDLGISKQTKVTNYCDSGKTNQILGWLYDVTSARSEDPDLECLGGVVNEGIKPRMEDEYIPSID